MIINLCITIHLHNMSDEKVSVKITYKMNALCEKNRKALRLLVFPLMLMWLELCIHIADSIPLGSAPVYCAFGLSAGFVLSAILRKLNEKHAVKAAAVLAVFLTLTYGGEFMARTILQTYYPFSMMGIAAGNKLYEFIGIVIQRIWDRKLSLVMMLLPSLFILPNCSSIFGKATEGDETGETGEPPRRSSKAVSPVLACILAFALLHGTGLVLLGSSEEELSPRKLYHMDTNYNEQVEQLGLCTMLRLDVRNMLFPSFVSGGEFDPGLTADPGELPETEPDPQTLVDRSPNVMDVDLAALSAGSKSADVRWLCDYFSSLTPSNKNEYTGMFEGFNLIFITMESYSDYAISPEYTPTLYRLTHEGFEFTNFYTALHFTSTSNGECQNLLGLYPKNGQPVSMSRTGKLKTNCYFSLAQQLNRLGYRSMGYHNNWDLYQRCASHTNLGYDWNYASRGLAYEVDGSRNLKWPQRDTFMVRDSADDFIFSEEPFNVYYLTVTSHTPYTFNWAVAHYKDELEALPCSEETRAYIATIMEVDRSVEYLLKRLEEAGKLENTLIVACADHTPYTGVEILEELTGREFGSSEAVSNINEASIDFDVYRNSLIIWSAAMKEPVKVDKVCCQVDILPTVSNLMGLEYDSRMLSGTDILSDSEGMVVFSSRCFLTDKGFYNRFTGEFTLAEGVEMSEEELTAYVERTKALAGYKLDCTAKIIESDFYGKLFGDEGRTTGIEGSRVGPVPAADPQAEEDALKAAMEAEQSRENSGQAGDSDNAASPAPDEPGE